MKHCLKKSFLFLSFLFLFFNLSCQSKNPFYGLDEEDKEGPDIFVDYPLEGSTVTSTFNLIGTAKDKGGDNTVLKIEVSLDNGASWSMAGGTTNWSYTVDPLFAWGIVAGETKKIQIKATDTDYKKNTTIKTISYVVNNTNPDLFGSIVDVNDTHDFNGVLGKDGYHQGSEGKTIRFNWQHEAGAKGYDIALYAEGQSDLFSKDIPASDDKINYDPEDINSNGPLTTGVSHVFYEKNGDQIYFEFEGEDGKQYFVAVKPYDNAGQRGAAKLSVSQTIDTVKPGNPLNFKVNGKLDGDSNKNFNSRTVTFSWGKATDTHTDIRFYKIDVNNNGTVDLTIPGDSSNFTYTYASDGNYTARIRAVDMAGNWSGDDWTELGTYVTNFSLDTGTPNNVGAIAITSDGGDGYQNAGEGDRITYRWAEVAGIIAGYDIQIINTKNGTFDLYSPLSGELTSSWATVSGSGSSGASNVQIRKDSGNIEFRFNGTNETTYQLQAKAYNNAGTRSEDWKVAPRNVMIDTTLPSTPSLTLINGKSAVTNNYSNTTANLFSWSAATDSASGIAHYQISTNGGSSVNGANETGTSASRTLAVGSYVIKVRAVDKAGNIGNWSSPTINLTVNTAGPSAPTNIKVAGLTGPLYYKANQNSTISWTAPGVVGSGLAYYQISLDNGASVNGGNETGTTANRSLTLKSNGDYKVCVRAIDNSGNIGPWSSPVVSVFVENDKPGIPTDLKVAGSTGPLYYNGAQNPIITWTNPNDGAGSGVASYEISLDNGSNVAGAISNGGNFSLPLKASVYNIRVRAKDNSGNIGDWSAPVSVFVENNAPSTPTNFKINGSGTTPQYGSSAGTFALSWDSSTDGTGSGVEKYRIYNGGTLLQDNITGNNYSLSLALGSYNLRVRAVDKAGNASANSSTIVLNLANTAPNAPTNIKVAGLTGPLYYKTNQNPTISWTAPSGVGSGLAYYQISLDNGASVNGANITAPTISATRNLVLKSNGDYKVRVRAIDNSGNIGPWSSAVSVFVEDDKPGIPTDLKVAGSTGPLYYNSAQNPIITWTNPNDGAGSGVASYEISLDNGSNVAGAISNGGNFSLPLKASVYNIRVRAKDNSGNIGDWSAPVSVFVENNAPSTPTNFKISGSGTTPQYGSSAGTFALSWDSSTDSTGSGVKKYRIYNGGVLLQDNITGNNYSLSLALGTHNLSVRAVDRAGNESGDSDIIQLVLANTKPDAPTGVQVAGSSGFLYYNSAQTLTISWTAPVGVGSGLAYYQISLDNGASVSGVNETGTSANRNLTLKSNGDYKVCVRAVDNSGNIGSWSSAVSVFVENDKPGIPTDLKVAGSAGPLYYNSAQNPIITWTNPNDGAGSGVASYEISLDNGSTVAGAITNGGNFSLPLKASVYKIRVRAKDNSNNIGDWSAPVSVFVEDDAPSTPTNFKINGSNTTPQYGNSSTTFALAWDSSNDDIGSGVEKYRIYNNGGVLLQDNITGNNYSLSLALGSHTLSVRAVDRAGNESGSSDTVELIIINTPPTFTTIATPATDTYDKDGISFSGFDGSSAHFKNYEYVVIENGLPYSFGSTEIGITNPVVSVASPTHGKSYILMARAIDLAGNTSPWITSKIITYDTVAPDQPSISDFYDVGGGSQGIVTWSAVNDSLSGLASYDLEVFDGTYTAVINISVDSSGNLTSYTILDDPDSIINSVALTTSASPFAVTLTFNYTEDTNVTVKIRATDNAGNQTGYDAGKSANIVY